MILDILKYPDERLKQVSKKVENFNPELHQLLDHMAETMYRANGIGLAAPQVGSFLRCFVIDIGAAENNNQQLHEFINPTISGQEGKITFEEGCLSVPGFTEEITRKSKIHVEYQDRNGNKKTLDAEDLLAVAIQHESDHLDGLLFIDRLSPLKRRLMRRKIEKAVTL
jgi:peptide deformylase